MDELKDAAKYITLATTGGAARYLHAYLEGEPFSWPKLAAKCFISGFAGYMVASIAAKLSADWVHVAAGVGGFAGTQALDFIIAIAKKKIDPQVQENKEVADSKE